MPDTWKMLNWVQAQQSGEAQRLQSSRSIVISPNSKIFTLVPMPGTDCSIWGFCFDNKIDTCVDPRWASDQLEILKPLLNSFEQWILNSMGYMRENGILKKDMSQKNPVFPQLVLAAKQDFSLFASLSRWLMSTKEEHAQKLGRWFAWFVERHQYQGNSACITMEELYEKEWINVERQKWASWINCETPENLFPGEQTQEQIALLFDKKHPEFLNFDVAHARKTGGIHWHRVGYQIKSLLAPEIQNRYDLTQKLWKNYTDMSLEKTVLHNWRKSYETREAKEWISAFARSEKLAEKDPKKGLALPPSEKLPQSISGRQLRTRMWFADLLYANALWQDSLLLKSEIVRGKVAYGNVKEKTLTSSQPNLSVRKGDVLFLKKPGSQFPLASPKGKPFRLRIEDIVFASGKTQIKFEADQEEFQFEGAASLLKQEPQVPEDSEREISKIRDKLRFTKPFTHDKTLQQPISETSSSPAALERLKALEQFRRQTHE